MTVINVLREWARQFKADWRNQVWTMVQWTALITILFSPVWTEHLGSQEDFRGGHRNLASSSNIQASIDPAITSTILRIPAATEDRIQRVFVNSSQVRFEWRRQFDRDPATVSASEDLVPVSMQKLSRERNETPQSISLIKSDVGEVVVSTYVELDEGVNTFRIRYQSSGKKPADLTRDLLVVFKKNK